MFGKKIRVYGDDGYQSFDVADVLREVAGALRVDFRYGGPCGAHNIIAARRDETVCVPVYKDGAPETLFYDWMGCSKPVTAAFTPEAAIAAIAAALNLELRAEYVVGSAEPQIVAVKRSKKP